MAVTKALRFQILRRDDFKCRYCGLNASESELHVDHVKPVALGGSDEPENLAAACKDCNRGKAATPADAEVVADVAADALRWAAAMEQAAREARQGTHNSEVFRTWFLETWNSWTYGPDHDRKTIPLEHDWQQSVDRWQSLGMDGDDFHEAIRIAMGSRVAPAKTYRYFCGVMWKTLKERQERAAEIVTEGVAA